MAKQVLVGTDFIGAPPTKLRAATQRELADKDEVNLISRDTFSNATKTVTAGTRYLAQIGTMSAARTVTLPLASSAPAGSLLIIVDESGTVNATNTISVVRTGTDTINGVNFFFIPVAYGYIALVSDGVNKWSCIGSYVGTDLGGSPLNPQLLGSANVEAVIRANTLDQLAAPAASVLFNSQRLVSLADGTLATDAATIRQVLNGIWLVDGNGWTRTGNTTFTQAADTTSYIKPGTKLSWKEAGVQKYGVVSTAVFATGTTTVTMMPTTDFVMAATPDAGMAYAYDNPFGFPTSFAWAPVSTGFASGPTQAGSWWSVHNGLCFCSYFIFIAGTSNATTYTVVAPIAAKSGPAIVTIGDGTDNGTAVIVRAAVTTGTITLTRDPGNLAWTASGNKSGTFYLTYPI